MTTSILFTRRRGYFQRDPDLVKLQRFYAENGFFVLEGAYSAAEVAKLNAEAVSICRGERGPLGGAAQIDAHAGDDEVLRRYLCIHFPHKQSAVMRDALFHPPLLRALTAAVGPNLKCMQSMLFIKPSGQPGQAWHQDEDYIPTRDRSLVGAWIALDRATVENGCLWVIPGSHRSGILWDQHWHGDRQFDCAEESRGFPFTGADAVAVEVEAGSIVCFNGYTLHRSLPNRAAAGTYRRALVNHYMSCESFLPWRRPETNVPMAKVDCRDVVVVAGTDPYAHRGYTDETKTFLRADGKSGCVDWTTSMPKRYADEVVNDASVVV